MRLRPSAESTRFSWTNLLWIGGLHVMTLVFAIPFFTWQGLVLFFVLLYLTGMVGITFGFHRLLTHKSFQVPRWLENLVALFGTLACQGGPISWVGGHRIHHMYSDRAEDPHDATRGFWYSHVGWLFDRRLDLDQYEEFRHYAPDLAARPFFVFLEKNMIFVQNILGWSIFFIASALGPKAGMDWGFGFSMLVWGIFARLVVGYHVTWFVNSAAHKWGTNPNGVNDLSKNSWWVALIAFGEGWHNNHHAQPRSARHGWHWWQFDQTWILIKTLATFGLVQNIVYPKKKPLKAATQGSAAGPAVGLVGDMSMSREN
ncbi:MAG: fatty acid desaturase [Silvanigrellales bacterium]|nr:fatty acid desaturase [Silvanigrellales bacterium]